MDVIDKDKQIKTYTDSYLYMKYPEYSKKLTRAIMQDDVIDKKTAAFQDVVYEVKRARVSDSLVRILNSENTVLLDCAEPLPKAFKVFCAKDFKTPAKKLKVFIDCTNVITKSKTSSDLVVDETKLISYLINAAICMVYHRACDKILINHTIIFESATCFAKLFTHIIDYLLKISIQESSKSKVMYLAANYFLSGILRIGEDKAIEMSKKIANINEREANMLNILLTKHTQIKTKEKREEIDPYTDINVFCKVLRDTMHFNPRAISTDIVTEKWMQMYGIGTVFGLEYFPGVSAILTDAYVGGYLNSQKTIETVCKTNMVSYTKAVISFIDKIV